MWAKENKNKEKMKEMTESYGGHYERKKNALELWNFIFVALGDTNDGRNIASTSEIGRAHV